MTKKFKVAGPEKPVKFLVIVKYAKKLKRLMEIKQNPYFGEKGDGNGSESSM